VAERFVREGAYRPAHRGALSLVFPNEEVAE